MDGKKNAARAGNLTEIDDDGPYADNAADNSGTQVVNVLHDYRQTKAF